jgi:rhamnosyltransferase
MAAPRASIIIRCRDEARDIGGVLCAVFSQKRAEPFEVIAVDSGSTDGTLDILRRFPVRLVQIPPEAFSFGRALNVGCGAARGEILVSLSAHVYPRHARWLAAHLRHFADPKVAATCKGTTFLRQDAAAFEADPYQGYENANGAFRAELWRRTPFDEAMTGTEDRAWAYHFQRLGYVVVCDPEVDALHEHPHELVKGQFRRAYREHLGFARILPKGLLLRQLARRLGRRGVPRNRESLSWYAGASLGILRG